MKLLDRFPRFRRTASREASEATALQYDALNPKGRRRAVSPTVRREDSLLRGNRRTGLQANAADLVRNLSLAGWMVRRHLDYVSEFSFHGRNPDQQFNRAVEKLMAEDSLPVKADVARKFGREKLFRLAETRRVLDGDTFLIKLSSMKLQGLQADLVKTPADLKAGEVNRWINGVLIDKASAALAFSVYDRKGYSGEKYSRRVQARNVIHYGFFDRYAQDQIRGVSPLVSALNPLRDVYENFDFALAKAKVSQLFALAFTQDGPDSPLDIEFGNQTPPENVDENGDHVEESRGFQAFLQSDLRFVDLNPGEKAEIIESKTPPTEFQNFTQLVIMCGLKALDIPFSFYDESHTNFFGSRAAWLHYERSCGDKRADQLEMRRNYTVWKLVDWVLTGRLVLPPGMTVEDVLFEWTPRGMPWWDPAKEIKGHVQAIDGGLDNPQRICKSTGTDYYDNVDKIQLAEEYAAERGVQVSWNADDSPPQPDDPEEITAKGGNPWLM